MCQELFDLAQDAGYAMPTLWGANGHVFGSRPITFSPYPNGREIQGYARWISPAGVSAELTTIRWIGTCVHQKQNQDSQKGVTSIMIPNTTHYVGDDSPRRSASQKDPLCMTVECVGTASTPSNKQRNP